MGKGEREAGGGRRKARGGRGLKRTQPWRPTKDQLAAAYNKKVADLIADDLDVLFCGINPGLYSGAVGHHFARPGNRFWPALHRSGFIPRPMGPFEEADLLSLGLGITNIVARTTARAEELTPDELRRGAASLRRKVLKRRPRWLALLGLGAYRIGFGHARATVGPQDERIGSTRIWLLPNPSGLNAHYQPKALAEEFGRLAEASRTGRAVRRPAGVPEGSL